MSPSASFSVKEYGFHGNSNKTIYRGLKGSMPSTEWLLSGPTCTGNY